MTDPTPTTEHAMYQGPTRRQRFMATLFPARLCDTPEPDSEITGLGDVIFTNVGIQLGWLDRLRVVATGKIVVNVRTATQHPVGATKSNSVAYPVTRFEP